MSFTQYPPGTITLPLAISQGGTNATTAAAALSNLGGVPSTSLLFGYVAANVTYNNTAALAAVAGMSVTVATGGIYAMNLVVQGTNAVKGLNMDFAGTVVPANFIGDWVLTDDTGQPISASHVTAIGTDFGPGGADGFPVNIYTLNGTLEVTTGGTFLLRGAQNVADASNTVILRGSYMTLTRLN